MFLSKLSHGVYYLFYHDELGKRRAVSTRCRHKPDALKFLQTFKEADRQKKAKLQRVTLSQFMKTYLEHSQGVHTVKTTQSSRTALSEFVRILGDLPLHKVGVREIEVFLARKKEEASDWTARKYYLALASAFETAKRWGHIASNPFRQVQKPKTPELLPVFLTRGDFGTLLTAMPSQDMRELVICAVSTGMRLGEVLAMRWSDVDLPRRVISVQNSPEFRTKNKRARVVPMTEGLYRMLLQRQARISSECELVFHSHGRPLIGDRISKLFKRAVRTAGLNERYHFHSLRHTFASWLAQDGVSLYAIQKLLGHSSSAVTQIYSHLQPSELHGAVNRIVLS